MVQKFNVQKLTSNILGNANHHDKSLLNPWGIVVAEDESIWVADNSDNLADPLIFNGHTGGVLTHYDLKGHHLSPDYVNIPDTTITIEAVGLTVPSHPTGLVKNCSKGFIINNVVTINPPVLTHGGSCLITCTEEGNIYGYNPNINPYNAQILVDNNNNPQANVQTSTAGRYGANGPYVPVYTGLTQVCDKLYVCDFAYGKIDVFDAFQRAPNGDLLVIGGPASASSTSQTVFTYPFKDITSGDISTLNPFNITHVGNRLYVSYAKYNPLHFSTFPLVSNSPLIDVAGASTGYINVFDLNGNFIKRLTTGDKLNSPWGMLLAPEGFDNFTGKLLVGNRGDGIINVFNYHGEHLGQLTGKNDFPLAFPSLWGLAKHSSSIYFVSAPHNNRDGLLGKIKSECNED